MPLLNPWSRINLGVVDSLGHRSLAWEAAAASVVLLENAAGDAGLPIRGMLASLDQPPATSTGEPRPLSHDRTQLPSSIAVLGEAANNTHLLVNRYTGTTKYAISVLAGIQRRAATDGVEVTYGQSQMRTSLPLSLQRVPTILIGIVFFT